MAHMTLLVAALLAVVVFASAQRPESAINAEAFCNGTDIQKLKCDWAGDAEQDKVASGTFAGTMWAAEPKPPQTLSGGGRFYFQFASKVVSLACKPGRLSVRTVFKFLPGSQGCSRLALDSSTLGSLGSDASSVRRCRLQVGPAGNGTDAAAIQAALAAPEAPTGCVTCANCASCAEQGAGVWYSDSLSFQYGGCAGLVAKPDEGYDPSKPGVVVNPGNEILLAGMTLRQG